MPSLLSDITTRLAKLSDTASLDASVLLAHIIKKPRSWVVAHPDPVLTAQQKKRLSGSLARLEKGEPFPHVLGRWEFFGMEFDITPNVLIPRPETELLVEKAVSWLHGPPLRRTVADIGTGSGIIAVSIAVHVPGASILATDVSAEALEVAKWNAHIFGVEDRIKFVQCDILPAKREFFSTEEPMDLICANLPYIPTETLYSLAIYGREPVLALDGGPDGLDLYRKLLNLAPDWLAPNGRLLLEIEATQGIQARNLVCDTFSEAEIHLHRDLAGHDRILEINL
jgi:release factor glutamine methyltransferase